MFKIAKGVSLSWDEAFVVYLSLRFTLGVEGVRSALTPADFVASDAFSTNHFYWLGCFRHLAFLTDTLTFPARLARSPLDNVPTTNTQAALCVIEPCCSFVRNMFVTTVVSNQNWVIRPKFEHFELAFIVKSTWFLLSKKEKKKNARPRLFNWIVCKFRCPGKVENSLWPSEQSDCAKSILAIRQSIVL